MAKVTVKTVNGKVPGCYILCENGGALAAFDTADKVREAVENILNSRKIPHISNSTVLCDDYPSDYCQGFNSAKGISFHCNGSENKEMFYYYKIPLEI